MEETFGNFKGMGIIVDDILISGKDEEHNEHLKKVLQKAREVGVKFNLEKQIFRSTSESYFGHLITTDGIKPDPLKVHAIKEIPQPSNKDELAMLLGMTNFLSKYIPNLSSLNYLLQELGKRNDFEWASKHTEAMEQIKTLICSNLQSFDTKVKYIQLKTDASKHGLGAELVTQRGWPIHRHQFSSAKPPYWKVIDELSSINGIILKGSRVVISALWKEILQQLHVSHLGMENTKHTARSVVYWTKMNSAIEDLIWNCENCGKFSGYNQKEPLILTPIPKYPWEYLALDFCKVKGRGYLMTSYYYSCFREINQVNPVTSEETIKKLKAHSARYSITEKKNG
ncbi:hypothetical protein QYM36_004107 [Artemia franciscana]|uniref:RNA-directed DNA polymerase n=1 Tax=Artemia franciscana TaxID=6661 RepID=A0AA88HXQ4_ARTSF|nr:hypothetical protein QYM36_004107 [Artemia franciscana]